MPASAARTLYTLVIALILLACLEQDSIAVYWRQAYHEDMPLEFMKRIPAWASGARANEAFNRWKARVGAAIEAFDHEAARAWTVGGEPAETDEAATLTGMTSLKIEKFFAEAAPGAASEGIASGPPEPAAAKPESTLVSSSGGVDAPSDDEKVYLNKTDQVLFVGDSMMQSVAPHVNGHLYQKYAIRGFDLSRQSTGLAYPDLFNWPDQVRKTLSMQPRIKLVVVFLGPNDPWDFPFVRGKPYLKFKSAEWESVYRARIRAMIRIAQGNDARVLWIAPPCMRKKELNQSIAYLNTLFSDEVKNSREFFLSTSDLVGCEDDRFSNFMTFGNRKVRSRADDGIHFTILGQKKIAEKVLSFIQVNPLKVTR